MRTVVDQSRTQFQEAIYNDTFYQYSKDAGFVPKSCIAYRHRTKGKVEVVAKLMNRLKYSLLIIDEIGYLPVDRNASYGFFQLIAARYENRSTILTTNQAFNRWGEVLGDPVIANAINDRLVHHCEIVKINGLSYRIKDKEDIDIAVELTLYCMKTQIFIDGNKRASIIFANHFMIGKGIGLLVVPESMVPEFKTLLVAYYEGRNEDEIKGFLKDKCWRKF